MQKEYITAKAAEQLCKQYKQKLEAPQHISIEWIEVMSADGDEGVTFKFTDDGEQLSYAVWCELHIYNNNDRTGKFKTRVGAVEQFIDALDFTLKHD